ncbi:hypothetical protein J2T10_000768 [Paenarthrobacter nicotinovorans]|uniref:DUF4393 domain-containing protein n=1 Tax=Paenarthrobacter nicotinovorans TaxID=29320 RepID=A0ABT9THL8_PAENI|nr:DUF4393 domain-containing protein [Paenarthrobacter nicotinovorans]MDQ0101149.1 hypothetical protein [Paenarthrobacter nicotinovorans]
MTGGEIAAAALAGKVVTHAGKELAEESKSIRKELLDQAKQTPEFEKAARSYATRLALRQELLTSMYKPIAKMLGVANKYFENDFEAEMAEKLSDVPDEHIVAPKASLAAPAMQHLGFSLDEPDLKELYLNLLATASDDRKPNAAHPSFVEVIKQLDVDELPFLEQVLTQPGRSTPAIRVVMAAEGVEGTRQLTAHLVELTPANTKAAAAHMIGPYIDNWCRLGLITADYESWLVDPKAYSWVEESVIYKAIKDQVEEPGKTVTHKRGMLVSTDFGRAFGLAVGIIAGK